MSIKKTRERMTSPDYLGRFFDPVTMWSKKAMKKQHRHPIFIYSPAAEESDKRLFKHLNQIVNIYDHDIPDFVINSYKIIDHCAKYYGKTSIGMYTLGQSIRFRVVPKQEPFEISLGAFFINYTMIILPMVLGADMSNWTPFVPARLTTQRWVAKMDEYIEMCRPLGNMRAIDECLEWTKHLTNQYIRKVGDKIGMTFDNRMIIELMNRSNEVRRTITCDFDIPDNCEPKELESITTNRTNDLFKFIERQDDLPISTCVRNGLINKIQGREFFVHISHKPDLYGNTIPYTYPTNNIMGTKDVRAHVTDARGGLKAEILKLNVSDAGAMERSLSMMMSQLRYVDTDWECDSKHFRTRHIESVENLGKLDGRVATLDPDSDEYFIITPKSVDLIGKTIYMKTPITCTHPRRSEGYICSACYGKLMANLNCDVHIGRLAALNSADDIEQQLLSAKHALNTNTAEMVFSESFDTYFETNDCTIGFNDDIIDMSISSDIDPNNDFNYLYFEFYLNLMKKHHDGEGRPHDRSVQEIVVYNSKTDNRTIIKEEYNTDIYLTSDFVINHFLPAYQQIDDSSNNAFKKAVVRIPFSDIIDHGEVICPAMFEYEHVNHELAEAILTLTDIMGKGSRINSFADYDECLDTLIPLFEKGGIHIPEVQCEMLISQMIYTPDRKPVDWTEPDPDYQFFSIDKSIQNINSVLTSLLYRETSFQIEGRYRTYQKTGTSAYDWFLLQRSDSAKQRAQNLYGDDFDEPADTDDLDPNMDSYSLADLTDDESDLTYVDDLDIEDDADDETDDEESSEEEESTMPDGSKINDTEE